MAAPAPRGGFTVRSLRWIRASLILFLVSVVGLLAVFLLLLPTVLDVLDHGAPRAAVDNPLALASLVFGVLEAAAGSVFVIGYADLWGSRGEHGEAHARSVIRARPFLVLTGLLAALGIFIPSYTGPVFRVPTLEDTLPGWAITAGILVSGLRALCAGLALYLALQGLASPLERSRLVLGMALGVVGAVAWPGILAFGMETSVSSGLLLAAIGAGVLAGLGTSAVSLGVFVIACRTLVERIGAEVAGDAQGRV